MIGSRIAAARESSGLTQQSLADLSGIERSALAKIERGLRDVGALELSALARALDVRLEWFVSEGPTAVASHRTRAGVEVELSTIDRELERYARDVELVGSIDERLTSKSPEPRDVPGSGTAAESLAVEARGLCGLDPVEPVHDLVEVVSSIGLLGFSLPLGPQTADAATVLLERGGVALVNSTNMVGRRRLALAHELGHYLVADDYSVDWSVADHTASDRTEVLLDRFARAFLTPAEGLRAYWQEVRDHVGRDLRAAVVLTSSRFRIDMSTLARRLSELDLATADECGRVRGTRTTKADIIEHGLVVPFDLDGVTMPAAYQRSVLALYKSEHLSAERTVDLLRGTLSEEELPDLGERHADEIWSVLG